MNKMLLIAIMAIFYVCCSSPIILACNGNPETHLNFVENKGQWQSNILYQLEMKNAKMYVEQDRLTFLMINANDIDQLHDFHHNGQDASNFKIHCHAYQMQFMNANPNTIASATCMSAAYHNYFIGKNQSKWKGHVPLYEQSTLNNLYNNIDLVMYGDAGSLKYDYVVKQGGNPQNILVQYDGYENIFIDNKKLIIVTSLGNIIEQEPIAYQYINGQYKTVACEYVLQNGNLSFNFPNGYDANNELIIDPAIVFATYTGSTGDNWGFTATYDEETNLYAGGAIFNIGYPTTIGAFDIDFNGQQTDISITKFSPDGANLVYSTYLGGTENEVPHSLIVSKQGNLYVLGSTGSDDYPVSTNAYDPSFSGGDNTTFSGINYPSGSDIVISKFNLDGSSLESSTYLGGLGNDGLNTAAILRFNYADEARGEIYVDLNGNVYVASSTYSPDFPTTPDAPQPNYNGTANFQEGCVVKLNHDLSDVLWGSFIGGAAHDAAYNVKVDNDGVMYICGGTTSNDLPTTPNSLKPVFSGGNQPDGYICKVEQNNPNYLGFTYLGTAGYNQSYFLDLDVEGNVYAFGQTAANYPVENAGYFVNNGGQFIHKLNNNLTQTIYSLTFGSGDGTPDIAPTAFLVDNCHQIFVSGWGGALQGGSLSTNGLPVTANAFDNLTDNNDFYFMVLEQDASALLYATYFGAQGGTSEHVDGGTSRFDKRGAIYQAVCAGCGGSDAFPTTPGVWSNVNNSSNCNLGAIKFDFQLFSTTALFSVPEQGCTPFTVPIQNNSINAVTQEWNFGDGTTSILANPPAHIYNTPGTYTISLKVVSDGSCNVTDTYSKTIQVFQKDTIEIEPVQLCVTDVPTALMATPLGGIWSGTGVDQNGVFNPAIGAGNYEITYTIGEGSPCPGAKTVIITVFGLPNPEFTIGSGSAFYCGLSDESIPLMPVVAGGSFSGVGVNGNTFIPANVPQALSGQPIDITYTVVLNGCLNTSTKTITVVYPPNPTFTPKNFCIDSAPSAFDAVSSGGTWSGLGINTITGIFNPNELLPGVYEITYTVGAINCQNSSTETVIIYNTPTIEIAQAPACLNNGTNSFSVSLLNPNPNAVSLFLNNNLVSSINPNQVFEFVGEGAGQTLNFVITDEITGCTGNLSIVTPLCPECFPDAGNMLNALQIACSNQTVTATTTGEIIEPGQVLMYALHKAPANSLNSIYDWSSNGVFDFSSLGANGKYYTEYYVSAVVGFPDINGLPILTDACTVYNEGTPILFLAPLQFLINEKCDWEFSGDFTVTASVKGGYPQYNPAATYLLQGDINNVEIKYGESASVVFPEDGVNVYEITANDNFGCLPITVTDSFTCIKTPISLLSFNGYANPNGNLLKWTTATEINSNFFTVYRSINGINFTPLATLSAAGNTLTSVNYEYLDANAPNGLAYYQLVETDLNAQTQTFNTIAVYRNQMATQLQITPNYVINEMQVHLFTNTDANAKVTVYNALGQVVYANNLTLIKGDNSLSINCSTWVSGLYFVNVDINGKSMVKKIAK